MFKLKCLIVATILIGSLAQAETRVCTSKERDAIIASCEENPGDGCYSAAEETLSCEVLEVIYPYRTETGEAERLKSFIGNAEVPTFTSPQDVELWSNRYDPFSNQRPKVLNIPYGDFTVCTNIGSKRKPIQSCFSLYDLTER